MIHTLVFTLVEGAFGVARLAPSAEVPSWGRSGPFVSITRNDEELSIVCREGDIPDGVRSERGFRCLKIEGPFDFSAVGVIASFATALASAAISVFVISTFDTDYLMIKTADFDRAARVLREAGHTVRLKG